MAFIIKMAGIMVLAPLTMNRLMIYRSHLIQVIHLSVKITLLPKMVGRIQAQMDPVSHLKLRGIRNHIEVLEKEVNTVLWIGQLNLIISKCLFMMPMILTLPIILHQATKT